MEKKRRRRKEEMERREKEKKLKNFKSGGEWTYKKENFGPYKKKVKNQE